MLELVGIDVRYGHKRALEGVSMRVNQGEIVTLIGSNGAGKTTALKTMSGLIRPAAGEIRFEGERIDRLPPHRIIERGLVQVPEGRLLFPDMTVMEHLDLGAHRARSDQPFSARLDGILSLFPILAERRAQKAGTLSGGQQQMLAIGRALMAAPRFLMLDEPSLGLAPVMVDLLADAIRTMHASGITILVVEQRVDLALSLADRGYVLETGRIVIEDSADRLLSDSRIKSAYLGI
ncbi:leucine/isoleucine/valine transporter ATP-binding subunit [Prosthecomicrobium hirschii]|uniref:Leucine/isoleucine/valine transporter ATP-binding subunit n=1 Tax=Prosthecodimorpha hirschii TaxID=665126 RepID=A0A0P6VNV3_9HYPH|nr:ABC transporter ATP-binding protein [Prosthecomicrobium hirschii]KPL53520.1 leucine/isoleucine/valine transporter ATP-binding subunit [Prosthecomicrobium hirschii]